MSELSPRQEWTLRRMVRNTHMEAVIRTLQDICLQNEKWCREEMTGADAIAREWARAAKYLDKAAEEIEQ